MHAPSHVNKPTSSLHGLDVRRLGGLDGLGVRRVGGRRRRQPDYGDRNDHRHNPQPPDHNATLLNPDMPVRLERVGTP
ncbi:MAG: hypothetical protein F4Z89_04215 [Acidimicrobiaceae bacterium]|nr:hypothetical protein [Acidimicrobiaceae bacterium]